MMPPSFSTQFMEELVNRFAGHEWSLGYLDAIALVDESGAVTGAAEHIEALRQLGKLDLGDIPPSPRFCAPSGFDD